MKLDHLYYDIYPRIVKSGVKSKITIKPKGRHAAFTLNEYAAAIIALSGINDLIKEKDKYFSEFTVPYINIKPENGNLIFETTFETEQEYSIVLYSTENCAKPLAHFSIYCLEDDMYGLRPYKIETHSHTNHSDGMESVEFVPPYYRRLGYDA